MREILYYTRTSFWMTLKRVTYKSWRGSVTPFFRQRPGACGWPDRKNTWKTQMMTAPRGMA